jgi:hypothetical protein
VRRKRLFKTGRRSTATHARRGTDFFTNQHALVTTQVPPLTNACGRTGLLPVLRTLVAMQVFLDLNTRLKSNRFPPRTTHARPPQDSFQPATHARPQRIPLYLTHAPVYTDLLPAGHTLVGEQTSFQSTRLTVDGFPFPSTHAWPPQFSSSIYTRSRVYGSPLPHTHACFFTVHLCVQHTLYCHPPCGYARWIYNFCWFINFSAACSSLRRRASTAELCRRRRGARRNRPIPMHHA